MNEDYLTQRQFKPKLKGFRFKSGRSVCWGSGMRKSRFALISVGLSLVLQGCSLAPRDTRAVYEPVTDVAATTPPMAQIGAEAGDVVSVLQSRESGILTQHVVLKGEATTGGENEIVVSVEPVDRRPGDSGGLIKPTESSIQEELDKSFGLIDMRLSQTWNRNGFGPFGYAIGHAAHNVTCVYAWQYSPGRQIRLVGAPDSTTAAASTPSTPTSVRVRLCLNEKQIVALISSMQIYPPGSSAPYFDPSYERTSAASRDALQAAGAPGASYLAPERSEPKAPAQKHRLAHRHRKALARDTIDPSTPAPGAIAVPLPASVRASAASSNPLLAPLQSAAPRAPASSEMPLPTPPTPGRSAAAETKPRLPPIPLPN